jgi:hypothetical protein
MTAPLGLATVVQKKNLVPVAKKEDFKMLFEKQNAKSALQDCIRLKLVPSPTMPVLDAHKGGIRRLLV